VGAVHPRGGNGEVGVGEEGRQASRGDAGGWVVVDGGEVAGTGRDPALAQGRPLERGVSGGTLATGAPLGAAARLWTGG